MIVPNLGQLPLDLKAAPSYRANDFLVTSCNADAVAWVRRWPEWPGRGLVIYGPSGCGKSHLARIWQKRTGALLVRGTQLNSNNLASVTGQESVVIDGVEDADDRALLHVYNEITQGRKTMFLTSTVPPANWPMVLPDLVSRISTLAVVGVGHPDDALLQGILVKQFSDRQLQVGTEVVIYLVSRMERSFEAARQIVAVLDAMALDRHRSVTVSLAGEALERLADFWLVTDKSQD